MVDRVHRDANGGTGAQSTSATGLADRHVHVLSVRQLTDGGGSGDAACEARPSIFTWPGIRLRGRQAARRRQPNELTFRPCTGEELDVVDQRVPTGIDESVMLLPGRMSAFSLARTESHTHTEVERREDIALLAVGEVDALM